MGLELLVGGGGAPQCSLMMIMVMPLDAGQAWTQTWCTPLFSRQDIGSVKSLCCHVGPASCMGSPRGPLGGEPSRSRARYPVLETDWA